MTEDEATKVMEERPEIKELMVIAMKALNRCKTKEERQQLTRRIMKVLETGE